MSLTYIDGYQGNLVLVFGYLSVCTYITISYVDPVEIFILSTDPKDDSLVLSRLEFERSVEGSKVFRYSVRNETISRAT